VQGAFCTCDQHTCSTTAWLFRLPRLQLLGEQMLCGSRQQVLGEEPILGLVPASLRAGHPLGRPYRTPVGVVLRGYHTRVISPQHRLRERRSAATTRWTPVVVEECSVRNSKSFSTTEYHEHRWAHTSTLVRGSAFSALHSPPMQLYVTLALKRIVV